MTTRQTTGPAGGAARFSEPTPTRGERGFFSTFAATAALLGLVGGVPALLFLLAGPTPFPTSLPTTWPTPSHLTQSLDTTQILNVLLVVVWLAWLQFVVCVAVEVAAALRGGVLAHPIPLSGPSQRLARLLVASVLLAGTVVGQVSIAQAAVNPARAGSSNSQVVASAPISPSSAVDRVSRTGAISRSNRHTARQQLAAGEAATRWAVTDRAAQPAAGTAAPLGATQQTGISKDEQALDGRKVYQVESSAGRHHDSLWEIAERHLGDGRRYHEIYRLNEGRLQPDGRTLHLARLIQPGWRLVMPEDAVGIPRYVADRSAPPAAANPANPADPAPSSTHTQAPSSTHTQAPSSTHTQAPTPAQAVPSSPATPSTRTAASAQATGRPVSAAAGPASTASTYSGLLPVAIPPESIRLPAAKAGAIAPNSTGRPSNQPTPAATTPAPTKPAATTPAATTPAATKPAATKPAASTPAPTVSAVPTRVAPISTTPAAGAQPGRDLLAAELIGAGLLTAALLSTLLVIRRRRGYSTETDPEDADTEVGLRTGADADRGALLDLALRSLSRSCRDVGRQLPQAYGAVVDDDGLDLLLTMAHPSPPPPWIATGEGLRWRMTYQDAQHLIPDGESAYPLLASVGRDLQGRDALINLGAAAGPVAVIGSPAMAAAVVRALALGLAGNPWSRGIEVLTCDLPAMLPAIAAGRLVPCAGARDLTDQLEQGSARMPRTGPIQILTGGPAPGSRPEQVAIYGAPLNAPIAQRLQALVVRRTELAVVVTGELPGASWRLRVDDAGNLNCEELSLSVTANRLGDGSIERLHALFINATTVGPVPGLPRERVPDPAGLVETDDVTWAQARARVAILGEVEVRAPGMIEASRLPLAGEIVSYLALHPVGVHPTVLASAIWPRGVTSDVRDGTLTQMRDWLGIDPEGVPRLREGHDGRLHLSPDVPCDWDVLRTLLSRAQQAPELSRERDLLVRALHLVRGPVAGGITHGTYTWLPRTDLERQAEELIVDAADRLSQICAAEGDMVAVEQASAAGLRAVPEAQHLWRHIIRAEHALGGPGRLTRVTEHLQFALATSGVDLEPETQALIEHLSSMSATTGSSS